MNPSILLVDDNPSNLAILFDHLDQLGYHVLVADNGIDAVEQVATAPPDLILLDVRMPGMDGIETCRAIKANENSADIPIIFLSALVDTDDRLKGFAAGGVDYIPKPLNVEEATARIKTHLTLAQLRHQLAAANQQLATTVNEQTTELKTEIVRRRQQEAEKEALLRIVREQNQQLISFTAELLAARPAAHLVIAQKYDERVQQIMMQITSDLRTLAKRLNTSEDELALSHLQAAQQRIIHLQQQLANLPQTTTQVDQQSSPSDLLERLTARELDVMRLLVDGYSTGEIAAKLQLSDITVRTYRSRIMQKLEIPHLVGLVKLALRLNLTTL